MWKEEELTTQRSTPSPPDMSTAPPASASPTQPPAGRATLGQTVVITGELRANENLTIEGQIQGTLEAKLHSVTVSQTGLAKAEILAKDVVVHGKVNGSITASNRVEIRPNGSVQGDVVSPAVIIEEGATFRGSIDMPRVTADDASRTAQQSEATADVVRPEEGAQRPLDTEIPVAAAGVPPQRQGGRAQKDASHAA